MQNILCSLIILSTGLCVHAAKGQSTDKSGAVATSIPKQFQDTPSQARQPEQVLTRYPSGAINMERWVVENKDGDLVNHGPYVEFDIRGRIECSGEYKMGKRTGSWTKRISSTQLKDLIGKLPAGFKAPFESKADFQNGQLTKSWTCTDALGKLVFLWNFKNGKRDGESLLFDPRGQTLNSFHYQDNLVHGAAFDSRNSDHLQERLFDNGLELKVVTQYHPTQKRGKRRISTRQSYLIPSQLNLRKHDWSNQKITTAPALTHPPIPHGALVTYYSNGQKSCEGTYVQGQKMGQFNWWFSNGQKKASGRYLNDMETGTWSWWHENGIRQARGTFANGVKIDQWSTWNENGKLLKRLTPAAEPQKLRERAAELPAIGNTIK